VSEITIKIGALGRPLTEQLKGLIPAQELEVLEADRVALTRALLRGYVPESLISKARTKLMKNIQKAFNARAQAEKEADHA
jgi:hypothetical protein